MKRCKIIRVREVFGVKYDRSNYNGAIEEVAEHVCDMKKVGGK